MNDLNVKAIEALPYRPCVGVMLTNLQGRVFVGQRMDRDPDQDAWQMPQGGIDTGESVEAAALRELQEETGIVSGLVEIIALSENWISYDLPHQLVPKIWKGRYRGQKQRWVLMRFNGSDEDVNIEQPHQEFSAWKWLKPEDLVSNIVPFKREVYERIVQEFLPRLSF